MENWSIRKQIQRLGLLALGVTLALSAVAVFSGWRMSGTFDEIRHVSQLLTNANIILEDEIEARFRARIFQLEPTEENAKLVRDEFQEMRELILEVSQTEDDAAANPSSMVDLDQMAAYAETFDLSVQKQSEVEQHVSSLISAGDAAREALNDLMESAFSRGDAAGAYYAGRAQNELLRSQSNAKLYIASAEPALIETAQDAYEMARTELARLDFILVSPEDRARKADVLAEFEAYWQEVTMLFSAIQDRDALRNSFDQKGQEINALVEQNVDDLEVVQTRTASDGRSAATLAMITLVTAAVIATLTLAVLSRRISTGIVRSIDQSVNEMTELAAGNLDIEITKQDAETELGETARTLEKFRITALESEQMRKEIEKQETERRRKEQELQLFEKRRKKSGSQTLRRRSSGLPRTCPKAWETSRVRQPKATFLNALTRPLMTKRLMLSPFPSTPSWPLSRTASAKRRVCSTALLTGI